MNDQDFSGNDPELDGKYLGTITTDFVKVADNLKEASYMIRKKGFSEFPVFPVSRSEIPIGRLLYGKDELHLEWNYYASYLEQFVEAKLIDKSRMDNFKEVYKDPDEFCCLFIVDETLTSFIYVPYPID